MKILELIDILWKIHANNGNIPVYVEMEFKEYELEIVDIKESEIIKSDDKDIELPLRVVI